MKRKITLLEKNLLTKNYKLTGKTYTGKHSDKVESYIYEKQVNNTTYFVYLDKTREKISHYSFTNNFFKVFDNGKIEGLQEVLLYFEEELKSLYDFEKKTATPIVEYTDLVQGYKETVDEFENVPFIEEGIFDD